MPHHLTFHTLCTLAAIPLIAILPLHADSPLKPVACEGTYPAHLQGITTNHKDALYWSWTTSIVKTDLTGRILQKVTAPTHQGDLCYHDGKVYVAVNLGSFNKPAGAAKSWVFVFDGDTLAELSRHEVPELVHGAGGMAYHDGRFIIIGGLPPEVPENYLYEYSPDFKFIRRHTLHSGHTHKGIQTIEHADGHWYFGCYGKPAVILRADKDFKFTGRWEFNASVGIIHTGADRFLIATNKSPQKGVNTAFLRPAIADETKGLILDPD
jgi:hypothetical protein